MVVFAGLVGYPPLSGSVDPGFLVTLRKRPYPAAVTRGVDQDVHSTHVGEGSFNRGAHGARRAHVGRAAKYVVRTTLARQLAGNLLEHGVAPRDEHDPVPRPEQPASD